MARSRFRGTCSMMLLAAGLLYAATYLLPGEPTLSPAVAQQLQAGKAAEDALRKVREDLSSLKEQLTEAEEERNAQQAQLSNNAKLVAELKAAQAKHEKAAADARAAAERAEAAAKLSTEKAIKEREARAKVEEAARDAEARAAKAVKELESRSAREAELARQADEAKERAKREVEARARAEAEKASAAVAAAKAEAEAASKRAADAALKLKEAERAASSDAKPVARPRTGGGTKPIPVGQRTPADVPGRACCPGEPLDTSEYDFAGTAFVTLASGNDAARGVIVLVQSLRDSGTRAENIVVMLSRGGMGSPECRGEDGGAWKKANGREHIHHCGGPDTIAEEIISPQYIAALQRLGAEVVVVPEIPSTQYTEGIPGGRATFWGMALNKLRVYNMTQYRKVIWMDGDTMVLKNVDHLFLQPTYTGAFTHACCNARAPAIPSGGLWVLEPSAKLWEDFWRMMNEGKPKLKGGWGHEVPDTDANGVQLREYWHWGDMQIVRWYFSRWSTVFDREPLWPEIDDERHGYAAGLQYFPAYRGMDAARFKEETRDSYGRYLEEGFTGTALRAMNQMGHEAPVWRALDVRYDQCVGNCDCIPERDMPDVSFTVHFSCIQGVNKPGGYATEREFGEAMYSQAPSCTRYWFWHKWYETFKRAAGRLPDPYTGPAIPGYDKAHDGGVKARLLAASSAR